MKRENKKKDIESFRKYIKKHHTGIDNVITCKDLHRHFKVSEATVREYVVTLRKNGTPICSCRFGYYYPETHTDVMETVTRFNKYLLTLSATSSDMLRATI